MAIVDTLNSIKENITNAYNALEQKGASIPEDKNIQNLASVIESISAGGSDTPSTEWQPHPDWWDIKTILENDTRNYAYKVIYLYTNATIAENELALNGQAYATSDGAFYETTTLTHTWDLSKDKPCYIDGIEAYKTRYIIVYSNSFAQPKNNQHSLLYFYGLDTSSLINFMNIFSNCYSLQAIPSLDTSKASSMYGAFENCYSLQYVPPLNTSRVYQMQYMFSYCYSLKKIPPLDTSKVESTMGILNGCRALISTPILNFQSLTGQISSEFYSCTSLVNLKLVNIKRSGLTLSSGTSYGHLLSQECLINIMKQLWDYSSGTTTYKLTIGTANTPKLANVYVKLITPTAEQIAEDPYIESKMPCEVCESTDDGAMLIMDYASAKGWTIL